MKSICKIRGGYAHFDPSESVNEINEKYSKIVWPTANIFGMHYIGGLKKYADFFKQIKIPVYVIGCGIQCKSFDDLDKLVSEVGPYARELVNAVYATGGELALRGYFTKEFLDKVTPNTAIVTGCPSMYQYGRRIKIQKNAITEESFRYALNGNVKTLVNTKLKSFLKGNYQYIDQDEFIKLLYGNDITLSIFNLLKKYSILGLKMFGAGRVHLIYDVLTWKDYMSNNFDFSLGSRIHGNIMAILAGVPAMVIYNDARTRELAEYFEIPSMNVYSLNKQSAYDLFNDCDFSAFNYNFGQKYDRFEKFMISNDIVESIDNSKFDYEQAQWEWELPEIDPAKISMIQKRISKNSIILNILSAAIWKAKTIKAKEYIIPYTNVDNS